MKEQFEEIIKNVLNKYVNKIETPTYSTDAIGDHYIDDIAKDISGLVFNEDKEFSFKNYIMRKRFDCVIHDNLYINNPINSSFKFLDSNKIGYINLDCMDEHIELNMPVNSVQADLLFRSLSIMIKP